MPGDGRAGLVALGLAALALRPQLVGIGPLIPHVQDDLGMSHATSGLLGTIPVLCMGLFALPGALLGARFGTRRAIAACLALIALAGALRAVAPSPLVLLVATLPVGIGMGACGALLPIAVKERFARRAAVGTGAYSTGIQIGAVSSALAVVGLEALGGWRLALAVLSVAAAATVVGWLALDTAPTGGHPRMATRAELAEQLRSPVSWVLVAVFGLMGMIYYGLVSWLPDAYQEHGWSDGSAAGLVAALSACQVPGALGGAWLGHHVEDRRRLLVGSAVMLAVGCVGVAAVPALGYAGAAACGLGMGVLFTVMLTLPLDLSSAPTQAGAIAAIMLTGGYCLAALAPVLLGALRDATGSFGAVLDGVAAGAVVLVALMVLVPRGHERHVAVSEF